jgi:hypothetical protein
MSFSVLDPGRRRAVDVLMATGDQQAAAAAAQVSDRTIRRWLGEPLFMAALQEAQAALLDAATADLVRASGVAVALLRRTVDNVDAPLALRIRAAGMLLDSVLRWRELRDLEVRLAALEEAIRAKGN